MPRRTPFSGYSISPSSTAWDTAFSAENRLFSVRRYFCLISTGWYSSPAPMRSSP